MGVLDKLLGRTKIETTDWIEKDALAEWLKGHSPPLVIDVRDPEEFIGPLGHIDSAENIPLDQMSDRIPDFLQDLRPLVMVCHTDRRSAAAARQLRQAGRTDVVVLRGGMVAWRA